MSFGVPLLGVDEVGEFGGTFDEEGGSVVERPVKVSPEPILRAKPRGSRAVSADPSSPPTVENRTVARCLLPTGGELGRGNVARSWVNSK